MIFGNDRHSNILVGMVFAVVIGVVIAIVSDSHKNRKYVSPFSQGDIVTHKLTGSRGMVNDKCDYRGKCPVTFDRYNDKYDMWYLYEIVESPTNPDYSGGKY